jgi:acyl-coenzyme A thioesterase PaaI-like protein
VAALVRARPNSQPTRAELDAHCRGQIAGYKVPRDIHFVADLQRQPSGKPDYRWAKAEAEKRRQIPDDLQLSWRMSEFSPDGAWGGLRQLAASLRALSQEVARVDATKDASASELHALSQAVVALTERVKALPSKTSRDAFVEGIYGDHRTLFMDRNGLVGLSSPIAPPIRLTSEGAVAVGELSFGPTFEGAPGFVHGGFLAAAFDQVFGWLSVIRGVPGLTASLTVHYRKPTPIEVPLVIEASLERQSGKKAFVRAKIRAGAEVTAEAEALFITIEAARFNALVEAS